MATPIYLDRALLSSEAFRSLSKWSILIYLDFLKRRKMVKLKNRKRGDQWQIGNNGELVYTYLEAEEKGISRRNFRNAIDELQSKGLIDIARVGSGGRYKTTTLYTIDERWRDYGTDQFKPPSKPRPKDTRADFGWKAYNKTLRSGKNDTSKKTDANDKIDTSESFQGGKSDTSEEILNPSQVSTVIPRKMPSIP